MSTLLSGPEHATVTAEDFRKVRGCFATGVTVITVEHEGEVHGMTASAFTIVSLDPPLVLVCVHRQNRTNELLRASQRFGIQILTEKQRQISEYYALPTHARCNAPCLKAQFFRTKHGTAGFNGSLVYLACRLLHTHSAGDHTLFVSQVEEIIPGHAEGEPLLYFRGRYRSFGAREEDPE